jgi:EmrB/QacA subfamily drug resistance transporter
MTTIPSGSSTTQKLGNRALIGLILAVSMTTIDQTIVALSAPTIQSELGLSHDGIQWAVNVYLLTTAAFFLLGGRLADVFGHKRMVLIGIAGFAITSLLCGLTPTGDFAEGWLVAARALQGISGAVMFPAAIGIVVESFPQAGRGKAMATFFATTGAMTALGPIAGGYLTQWTWRSIFWINLPIAGAAFVIIAMTAASKPRTKESIDWLGAAVAAAGMAFLIFGLQQASDWGWSSIGVWGSLVIGAALLVGFVLLERRIRMPLVRLEAFRDRGFMIATLVTLFASIAFISTFFFLSVYGQVSLQLSANSTGLLFLKFFIGFVIASRFGSRLFDRSGARAVYAIGGVIGAVGFAWLASSLTNLDIKGDAFFNAQTWPIAVAGAGIGFVFAAASTDAVNRSIGTSYGEVTAISQTMKNFGGALGLAVFSTIVNSQLTDRLVTSFTAIGGTAAQARSAVDLVTGASGAGSSLGGVPSAVQAQILHAVQSDYAAAVQVAFYGMAISMAVLIVLALLYPTKRPSAVPSEETLTGATTSRSIA